MLQVICPGCSRLVEVGMLPAGSLASCPYCGGTFLVPEAAAGLVPETTTGGAPADSYSDPADLFSGTSADNSPALRRQSTLAPSAILILMCGSGALLALVLIFGLSWLRHQEMEQQQAAKASLRTIEPGTWRQVASFSGSGNLTTRRFRVESRVCRVNWSTRGREGNRQPHTFRVLVFDDDRQHVSSPINAGADEQQTNILEIEPGTYFLVIRAAEVEWQVSVEDQPGGQ